jgi:hypothetical protein
MRRHTLVLGLLIWLAQGQGPALRVDAGSGTGTVERQITATARYQCVVVSK